MRVFICYQRDDSQHAAGRIKTLLEADPGVQEVFFDRTSIGIGRRWKDVVLEEIEATQVVLAVIGPGWNCARLHEADDHVRFELESAYGLDKLFVPLVVAPATVPARDALPDAVAWLVDWQAFILHEDSFDRDVGYLIEDLVKLESGQPDARPAARGQERPGLSLTGQGTRTEVRGLWVDDHPDNNERERGVLEDFGIEFDLAVSTSEAMRKLRRRPYKLVISDMGRHSRSERDKDAGLTLIDAIADDKLDVPVIIYGARRAVALRDEIVSRGGAGSTSSPFELYELVRRCIQTSPRSSPIRG